MFIRSFYVFKMESVNRVTRVLSEYRSGIQCFFTLRDRPRGASRMSWGKAICIVDFSVCSLSNRWLADA